MRVLVVAPCSDVSEIDFFEEITANARDLGVHLDLELGDHRFLSGQDALPDRFVAVIVNGDYIFGESAADLFGERPYLYISEVYSRSHQKMLEDNFLGRIAEFVGELRQLNRRGDFDRDHRAEPLDAGDFLLETVTVAETRGLELILSLISTAHAEDQLTERQQIEIMAIADAIRMARAGAEPGRTPRWKIVAFVGGALIYLFDKFPSGVIKWIELSEKLEDMGWNNLAEELRDLIQALPT